MKQFLTKQSVKIMILRTTTQNEITELLCQWFLTVQRAVAEEEKTLQLHERETMAEITHRRIV